MEYITDRMSIARCVYLLRNDKLKYEDVYRYLSMECPQRTSVPSYKKYTFVTMGQIKNSITDTAQLDRFMRRFHRRLMGEWFWIDDGMCPVDNLEFSLTQMIGISFGFLVVGFYLGSGLGE